MRRLCGFIGAILVFGSFPIAGFFGVGPGLIAGFVGFIIAMTAADWDQRGGNQTPV